MDRGMMLPFLIGGNSDALGTYAMTKHLPRTNNFVNHNCRPSSELSIVTDDYHNELNHAQSFKFGCWNSAASI